MTPTADTPDHAVTVVLGMHRSGTSALTEALMDAGLHLPQGEHLVGSLASNARGHFEDRRVVDLNSWIMGRHGAAWDQPWPMRGVQPSRRELRRVARLWRVLSTEGTTVMKDPRLSLTLEWWRTVWQRTGTRVNLIEIIRRPSQVAGSLQARNNMPEAFGELLWKEYVEQTAINTAGATVHRVWHHDLMQEAPGVLRELGRSLGLSPDLTSAPGADAEPGLAAGTSVDPALQHQVSDRPPQLAEVREFWAALTGTEEEPTAGAEEHPTSAAEIQAEYSERRAALMVPGKSRLGRVRDRWLDRWLGRSVKRGE